MNADWLIPLLVALTAAMAAAAAAWLVIQFAPKAIDAYESRFTRLTQSHTRDLFLSLDPKAAFGINLFAMIAGTLVVWFVTDSILLAILGLVLLASMPRIIYARMRAARLKKFDQQLPDSLMMIAGGLRAGLSLTGALHHLVEEAPAPLRQEMGLVLRENRLGMPLDSALTNLARRVPTTTTILVVSAMRVANETGGGLAETLERTSTTVRRKLQMEDKIDALTSQGKLQAWVVGSMPIALMLVLNHIEPVGMHGLWHTTPGWIALAVIFVLEVIGVMLIRRITTIDV